MALSFAHRNIHAAVSAKAECGRLSSVGADVIVVLLVERKSTSKTRV